MKYNHLNQLLTTLNELFHFKAQKGIKKRMSDWIFWKKCDEKQVFILERPNARNGF